jgi:thiosulfate/3-mercaptopyruvate sulfurtransferase
MDNEKHLTTRREFVRNAAMMVAASALPRPLGARDRDIPPIVSPEWLATNLGNSRLVLLDIRNADQYKKGHIPGSLNVPLSSWAITRNGLTLELPPEDTLRDLIGKAGMNANSCPVIVNRVDTDFSRADATRVAWTCAVAGLENAVVLDGGYNRWLREIKATSSENVIAKPAVYTGKTNAALVASKDYVWKRIGKSILVDTRLPEDYFGIDSKPGHIKGAVDLPAPWAFASDGTYKKEDELRAMAEGVIGSDKAKEIILYCGVGGFSAAWWFLLARLFEYRNVKVFDGSMEEWARDPAAPVSSYTWH